MHQRQENFEGRATKRLEHMTKRLNLTPAQQGQLGPVLQAQAKELKAVHDDKALTRPQRMEKFKQIRESYKPKIEGVLTPEQRTKHENDAKEWKERWQERRAQRKAQKQAAAGAPAPAPAPSR